jgi:hypothetical protein
MIKSFLSFAFFICIAFSSLAQKREVKLKNVTPKDVTKKMATQKSLYSLEQFNGKWQEIARMSIKTNSSLAFKDTLFYNFLGGGEVFTRDGVSMSMKGEAAIEPNNVLVAAADVFTIRSMNNNQVVLDDGEYVHTLIRKKQFWYESMPNNAVVTEKFITAVSINASALAGEWKVYRREAKPGTIDKVLIKTLNIQAIKNDNNATGEVTFYKTEKTQTLSATFMLDAGRLRISTEKDTWNLIVYKADGKELVFGDGAMIYYCKPL